MTFEFGIADAFEKTAKEKQEVNPELGVVQIAGGTALGLGSRNLVTGKKRLYHGTSMDSWNKIKDEGLRASMGGNVKGAGGSAPGLTEDLRKHFRRNSKGKIHVTRSKSIANMFGKMTGKDGGGKKILKMDIPYDQFRRMEVDPDMVGVKGRLGRNIASRTAEDISTDYIAGANKKTRLAERLKQTIKGVPAYAKKYPGRFGAGLALTAAGTALAAKGVKNISESRKKK